jgi:hypothetical protein
MSKVRTITPVATINVAQLKDDVETMLTENGFTLNDLARLEKQQAYRREYAQRPNVVEKRKEYNKQRYVRMQMLKSLLRERVVTK